MRLPTTLLALSVSLPLVSALPFPLSLFCRDLTFPIIHKRGLPGAVYICTERNFAGECGWVMPSTNCHIPGTGDDTPRSIGPDPGGFCILYEKATCKGNQVLTLRFPGADSAIPEFGGMKCFANGVGNMTQNLAGAASGAPGSGDARLAGGIVREMVEKGHPDGMIGLEKGVYY
ncbi:uncharacterized protein BDR25DRAFT_375650 [Lindgomyces ingoldianus]|uniref:Uncharacterized protein n=1 Tax=Lindgomyces ingoldianus TaxID=673940 RepID=A0ACB6RC19_9PLEO|nr:uncharacterized protein BDR25DRAFT_375650 [Lindgomyces ingoldianus]KAF2476642.1 hypothetical protein BDR25DRAFT_375650 [Lindgomyces ingoldianus]